MTHTSVLTGKQSLTYIDGMVAAPTPKPDVFAAISHRARRQMLDLLAGAERSVSDITTRFEISRPAVSQHLRVLLDAGLVTEQRHGRERRYRLVPEQLGPGARLARFLRAVLGRPPPASANAAVQEEQSMTKTIRREIVDPAAARAGLACLGRPRRAGRVDVPERLRATVGHRFTFQVPPNPSKRISTG